MLAIKKFAGAIYGAGLLLLCSCGTPKQGALFSQNQKVKPSGPSSAVGSSDKLETDLYSGNFKLAASNIDNNKFLLRDRNKLLYIMEKGKVEYMAGNYKKSNDLFEEAYIMLDDKIKTKAGQAVAASLTNPMAAPYKGEDFEKVAIHYYKALNYFAMGNQSEALVEAKRINIKLTELNDKYKDNKNKYAADAFSQIVQGVLYECAGNVNDAFISYRNAAEIYEANNNAYFGVPMPDQLKLDLIRTSKQLGFTAELRTYQQKYKLMPDTIPVVKPVVQTTARTQQRGKTTRGKTGAKTAPAPVKEAAPPVDKIEGEVIVFWENGLLTN